MKHPSPVAPGVMALVVLAACFLECSRGGAIAAEADHKTVNPCKLITQAEAQAALGMPVKPGEFVDSI